MYCHHPLNQFGKIGQKRHQKFGHNLLLLNQLRKISYLIEKHSKSTKTWKYNLLLNVYLLEPVLLHHLSKCHQIAARVGWDWKGFWNRNKLKWWQSPDRSWRRTWRLCPWIYSVEGRVCFSLSQPPLLLFYCSWRRVQSCCAGVQGYRHKIVYRRSAAMRSCVPPQKGGPGHNQFDCIYAPIASWI